MEESVSLKTLADLLMLDPRRIQQLAEEDIVKKAKRGEYLLIPSIQGYITFIKERADGNTAEITDHKTMLIKAKAEIAAMEAGEKRSELIPASQVQTAWETLVGHFRTKLLAMPEKIAARVLASTNVNQAREIIKRSVHEALAELSSTEIQIVEDKRGLNT